MPEINAFSSIIRTLGRGKKSSRSLSFEEAKFAMTAILEDKVAPEQIGAFLMLLRVKEESPEEIAGFVSSVRETLPDLGNTHVDLDWSSYAGKRKQEPWFILAVLALANAGIKVFIHGSDGHTDHRIYTSQLLHGLGFTLANNWQEASDQLSEQHFSFLHLQHIHPRLEHLINLKPLLGLRSPINTLVRLINPYNAAHSISSVFHPAYGPIQTQAMQLLKQANFCVFKGEGGEIEARPEADTKCYRLVEDSITQDIWPRQSASKSTSQAPLNLQDSCKNLKEVWAGAENNDYAALAIHRTLSICMALLHPQLTQEDCAKKAATIWQQRDTSFL